MQGKYGVNKVWVLIKDQEAVAAAIAPVVVWFGGDVITNVPEAIHALQQPKVVLHLLASKFPSASALIAVSPSRIEGNYVCYDHFLPRLTRSGEPLGYDGRIYKASGEFRRI